MTPFSSGSIAEFKLENIYWDSFFWIWYNIHIMHNKLSHGFFSNNKVHVQATSLLKRNKHWNAFRVWLYEKQLGSLRGISHSRRCCWYVIFLLFLFCVYIWSSGMTRFRSKMRWTKIDINTSASLSRRKLCQCVCTNLNKQKVKLIFTTWLWARLVWRDGADFT